MFHELQRIALYAKCCYALPDPGLCPRKLLLWFSHHAGQFARKITLSLGLFQVSTLILIGTSSEGSHESARGPCIVLRPYCHFLEPQAWRGPHTACILYHTFGTVHVRTIPEFLESPRRLCFAVPSGTVTLTHIQREHYSPRPPKLYFGMQPDSPGCSLHEQW